MDDTAGFRPRRCCPSVPGTDPGKIDEAVRVGADEVVDLGSPDSADIEGPYDG